MLATAPGTSLKRPRPATSSRNLNGFPAPPAAPATLLLAFLAAGCATAQGATAPAPRPLDGAWLQENATRQGPRFALKDADPATPELDLRLATLDSFARLTPGERLRVLPRLTVESRSALLDALPPAVRDEAIGGGDPDRLIEVWNHDTGPELDFDWSAFDFDATSFSVQNIRGLGVMSKRAYEPFGEDGRDPARVGPGFADFARQGFSLYFFGRDEERSATQAFVAVRGRHAVLAFRGTTLTVLDDLLADARAWTREGYGGRVHAGFAAALEEVWPDIEARLAGLVHGGGPLVVHVTGHSLGAALATLAALRAQQLEGVRVASVVPLASPRVLDEAAARAYEKTLGERTFRIVNNTDAVSQVPPERLGYRHVGHLYYFDTKGRLRSHPTEEQVSADRSLALWSLDELARSARRSAPWKPAVVEGAWDHGPLAYCRHLYANSDVHPYGPGEVARAVERYLHGRPSDVQRAASRQLLDLLEPAARDRAMALLSAEAKRALLQPAAAPARDADAAARPTGAPGR